MTYILLSDLPAEEQEERRRVAREKYKNYKDRYLIYRQNREIRKARKDKLKN